MILMDWKEQGSYYNDQQRRQQMLAIWWQKDCQNPEGGKEREEKELMVRVFVVEFLVYLLFVFVVLKISMLAYFTHNFITND